MTCPCCANTGYRTVDIGTITIPDFVEVPCNCNPAPTDADAPDRLDCMDETWEHSDPAIAQQCDREPDRCTCRAYCDAMDAYYGTHPWHDDRAGWPGETEYPADLVLPVVDFDALLPA